MIGRLLAALLICLAASPSRAQVTALSNCSQTVGASAAAVPFPTQPLPRVYLEICNAHASNTLGVCAFRNCTASIGAAGTETLQPGWCLWWTQQGGAIPGALSVIGSGGGTTTACWYQ